VARAQTLDESGFARLVGSLEQKLGDRRHAARARRLARTHAADEQLALASLTRLAEESASDAAEILGRDGQARALLLCLGASEVIATELSAAGPGWRRAFEDALSQTGDTLVSEMRCDLAEVESREDAIAALSAFKRRMFLRIAIGDLTGALDVSATMAVMSRLADECIRSAFGAAKRLMGAQAGELDRFCVLAMGKLGAGELNLSSDIDLVYVIDAPGSGDGAVAAARFGELLTELLSSGCFRIDLRLRPGGRSSPLVVTLNGALGFYQSLGQTWERAALLRARPVAGALDVGARLLKELDPFIYRRYLDFDTLRQLRAMKHQIEAELRLPEMVRRNIKLGYGGIRELEFIVQALTLIYGGRDPRIRTRKTIEALDRLASYGYMPRAQAEGLAEAYLFLRNVEHKLQVAAGLQTHTLPDGAQGMRALAIRLGMGGTQRSLMRLGSALSRHRRLVARQFRETLAGGAGEHETRVSAAAETAWRLALEPGAAAPALKSLGFAAPEESVAHLELLARGPAHAHASPRRSELLVSLGPVLLDEIAVLPDPDLALRNLAAFISAVGARTSFLALLEQHPATRRVLLKLFASSSYLSGLFIRHPEMLDTLVRSDLARPRRAPEALAKELAELVAASPDFESRLDAIRTFRHQEFLRIAIADLAGHLEHREVEAELTALAETVLREALELARAEVGARFPIPPDLALACIAMGRLGAAEMAYNSDLDLIFVYEGGEHATPGGHELAARLAQKLIAILETRTREGYAYKLDLRLRPSGTQGPLVTSLKGFRDYHRQSSAVWERQALVRARVVAGDDRLGAEIEAARQEFVFGRGLRPDEVEEIRQMRERMEREIGVEDKSRLNLKQGRGGLVDVEFVAQMMALAHGARYPKLRARSTLELIRALRALGLLSRTDAKALEDGYEFLSLLENRLRIESDQAAWALPTRPEALMPVARRMGYRGREAPKALLAEVAARRDAIRRAFDRCFDAERARAR
jgi:glutamate-ammonia-ligase adenylyltransferase